MSLILLWALLGWLVGIVVNHLADFLPAQFGSEEDVPFPWQLPGLVRLLRGERRPIRPYLIELLAIALFAALPTLIDVRINLFINSFHIAVLLLIIVIDLEHRLIFDVVTYPATVLAFIGSFFVTIDENTWQLSLVGAIAGFVIFWLFFRLAMLLYGASSGALGGGDVKLAMLMGAMLGLHRIFFALFLGVVLGGIFSAILLLSRRVGRETALPYGQYLAVAAIVMLIWGADYAQQYIN